MRESFVLTPYEYWRCRCVTKSCGSVHYSWCTQTSSESVPFWRLCWDVSWISCSMVDDWTWPIPIMVDVGCHIPWFAILNPCWHSEWVLALPPVVWAFYFVSYVPQWVIIPYSCWVIIPYYQPSTSFLDIIPKVKTINQFINHWYQPSTSLLTIYSSIFTNSWLLQRHHSPASGPVKRPRQALISPAETRATLVGTWLGSQAAAGWIG